MNRQKIFLKTFSLSLILMLLVGCSRNEYASVEEIIIAKEKMFLDEWGKGHTMIFPQNSADEITYFDPELEKRIDGIEAYTNLMKPLENTFTIEKYEMLNPNVQVHGEIAVLTFNLIDYSRDSQGELKMTGWNSTEVYRKMNGDWKIIHSHWSYTKPELKN